MFSPPAPDPRRRGPRGSAPIAFIRRALVAAILVGLHGAGTARAKWPWNIVSALPVVIPKDFGIRKCRLYGKFIPIRYESFLFDANDSLFGFIWEFEQALNLLVKWKDPGVPEKHRGYAVIRVTAPPGYGKSALFRYLEEILDLDREEIRGTGPEKIRKILRPARDTFRIKNHLAWIRLDRLGGQFDIRSAMLEDLKNDDGPPLPAFGRLRAFEYDDHSAPDVELLVKASKPDYADSKLERSILIIDSIDEIHPESAKSLLLRIDEYIGLREAAERPGGKSYGKRGFLRVFVVGRPEGFTDYYRVAQGGVPKRPPIRLEAPKYNGRHPDADRLAAIGAVVRFLNGEEGYKPLQNIFFSIRTINFIDNYRWCNEMMANLSGLNDLVRFSSHAVPPHLVNDDFALKDIFFQSLLARARDTHNRPVSRGEDYVRLLEEAAMKFAGPDHIDGDGYFVVSPVDTVEIDVEWNGRTRKASYLVESVLNRSGVVDIESVDRFPRYRFYPSWVRDHLRERYLRRK